MSRQRTQPAPRPGDPVTIDDFLASEGFLPEARAAARAVLEEGGITNPRKKNLSREKLARASALLAERVVRVCSDECRAVAGTRDGMPVLASDAAHCDICAGSGDRRAAGVMAEACERAGLRRLLILGGTATKHRELSSLLEGSGVELRLVDGVERQRTKKDAIADLRWTELLVVWASTPLPHK
ncbi:MAG: hypothetical protein ACM3S1_03840, partial [Hyphomicrobiales bacterium]